MSLPLDHCSSVGSFGSRQVPQIDTVRTLHVAAGVATAKSPQKAGSLDQLGRASVASGSVLWKGHTLRQACVTSDFQ